ncbi:MaoC family dehydratase [Rhizobium oryzihabitans]|jgi:3-hydroxybutyryl-CoA dehydratase|uniref:MaoC family dehydratase n=1 Tax=Rhizobium oryzihabitans TaxID=2267833 RepID=A0A7L5BN68_9HYPH|nr:MaoC family dehydratase [Rhizobium oryzihabitans]EGP55327.1 putative acyl dehydratase [Agrobacterium tumefaciens F2]MCW0981093.1 MaoC family dehydratase [Agrobacterium sp. BT-220-3]QCM07359.1 MaoC family dehydratase [Agrobacterium tumefaciens]CUX58975.1 putative acyl dehydratase [Agrobacterium genomosp. 5 str. CFBP 6626]HBT67420.1 acyl dehydratase [Agrobacterium sp.]
MYDPKSFDDLSVGEKVTLSKTITEADGALYIAATGDFGPVHVDEVYAGATRFGKRLAPGIMVAGLCTSVLTSELVGTIGVSIEDRFWFTGPVFYGDTITFDVWIAEKREENRTIIWQASARNTDGLEVLKAEATLKFPRKKPAAA